jgi:hypothetical protein
MVHLGEGVDVGPQGGHKLLVGNALPHQGYSAQRTNKSVGSVSLAARKRLKDRNL